ncbi:o-succinylbenzoate synthase [Lishizhenia tianjinensis]|uniref:O-succinylbenzoate synthase n=1 Tax=Lishizhenia tianjinensis TaxID=477690 RepID=A0A1I6YSG8_9FLAO|nr:o-succinylbenzoate synthase [Lishizhenia tianjinensis]SFT53363.1 o-succinylbenzoate synthase [Lishizhenia tianjinensis]
MSLTARFEKKTFDFKRPSGTSRGVLTQKHAWFIYLKEDDFEALGECSIITGLSPDFVDFDQYEAKVKEVVANISYYVLHQEELETYPSILFGLEMALENLKQKQELVYFPSDFTTGQLEIPINGLIWMGEKQFMYDQIQEKIAAGFDCIKMKIGAIDFEAELELLSFIRSNFSKDEIEIRVDANGAFAPEDALEKLERLAAFDLHSIEQPIKAGQIAKMRDLCKSTPLAIALDEELIGVYGTKRRELLETISPQYIILKPSLHGGIVGTKAWIALAEELNIKWWMTSALESNVGLSCIAQLTALYNTNMYQGLGTGQLYTNNIESPLEIRKGKILTKID